MAFDYADAVFTTPLVRAILNNEKEEVRKALNEGFNTNLPDNRGWTPLHETTTNDDRIACLEEILAHKSCNINAQTFLGETPLYLACQNNCVRTVNLLLKQPKCNVNIVNSEGVSPLHVACNKGNLQIIQSLVECGAKVNSQDFNCYTPLHETVASGNGIGDRRDKVCFEICQYLLKHGANADVIEYEGNYPFHFACQNGLLKCANLLYSATKQCNLINLCNNDGRTPLMMAIPSQNLPVVEMLLSNGADANIADKSNIIALHLAAHTAHFDIFNMVLKATNNEHISKYCTFDEERDLERVLSSKKINSLICLAIDTEDLPFLIQVLESNVDPAVLQCPVIHAENLSKKSFTLHTPISFLLESKMSELEEKTVEFLLTLINYGSPLKMMSKEICISYINPVCAGLVALNDCSLDVVMKCLKILLENGADPDEPYGRMPFAMEQACMRVCSDAVRLLLQYSNILEPEDVIKWIEQEMTSDKKIILKTILPLAPYCCCGTDLPDLIGRVRKNTVLTPQVYSLANYCRTVIRRQLHKETQSSPCLFRQKLFSLAIPKELSNFLSYM